MRGKGPTKGRDGMEEKEEKEGKERTMRCEMGDGGETKRQFKRNEGRKEEEGNDEMCELRTKKEWAVPVSEASETLVGCDVVCGAAMRVCACLFREGGEVPLLR